MKKIVVIIAVSSSERDEAMNEVVTSHLRSSQPLPFQYLATREDYDLLFEDGKKEANLKMFRSVIERTQKGPPLTGTDHFIFVDLCDDADPMMIAPYAFAAWSYGYDVLEASSTYEEDWTLFPAKG
jgi:hypothetical protein